MGITLGARMRQARKRIAGLTQQKIAEALRVDRATVSQWETDAEKPGRERLAGFAELCGVTIDSLFREPPNEVVNVDELAYMPQNVPVLGTGVGGYAGDFVLNGEISEYVRRPPGIANAPQVFAVWVTGDSMYPKFSEGDLIYIHPGRRARIGDDVLIEMVATVDGKRPAFVKRLLKRTETELLVEQFNPPREFTFDPKTVEHVYHILTTAEQMGV